MGDPVQPDVARFDALGLWHYRARYVRARDGDTITVLVDLGFSCFREMHVRLAGYDAPERTTPEGKIALLRMRDIFASDRYTGAMLESRYWPLRVVTEKTPGGHEATSFERYVASVFLVGEDGRLTDLRDLLRGE